MSKNFACFSFLVKNMLKNSERFIKYFLDILSIDNYVTKRVSPTFILKLLIKVNTHSKNAGFCKHFLNSEVG